MEGLSRPPRFFFSLAHPDDESFSGGATACRYGARGAQILLVTATRGDSGKRGDPPVCTEAELPNRRETELREAAAILGIQQVHVLDHRDRQLAAAPPDRVRAQLVGLLRGFRPHVVLTFDPNGLNGHPDHIAISRFTSDAVAAAADASWLSEAGPPHRVQRLVWTSPILPWEAGRHTNLGVQPGVDFIIDISPWRHRKAAALRAHRTQHLSIDRCFLSQPDLDRILSLETFRQAWGPPLQRTPSGDLLEGLVLED